MKQISTGNSAMIRNVLIGFFSAVSSYAVADSSFNSIGGYRIGQPCTGSEFSKSDSEVSNPDNVLDSIKIKRNQIDKKIKGGHSLLVVCGLIDNKIIRLSLTSNNRSDISVIKESLKEKMGRPADNREETNSEPMNILGNKIDGFKMATEKWFLGDSRTVTAFTIITVPYGFSSLSELKWDGGIELSINDSNKSEWNYLKQQGRVSSKQEEALKDKRQKDHIRGLLNSDMAADNQVGTGEKSKSVSTNVQIEAQTTERNGTPVSKNQVVVNSANPKNSPAKNFANTTAINGAAVVVDQSKEVVTTPVAANGKVERATQRVASAREVLECAGWLGAYAAADAHLATRIEEDEWGDLDHFDKLSARKKLDSHPLMMLVSALAKKGGGENELKKVVDQTVTPEATKIFLQVSNEAQEKKKRATLVLPKLQKKAEDVCNGAGERGITYITLSNISALQ